MKRLLKIVASLLLVPTFSLTLQGCDYQGADVKYDNLDDAIESLKLQTFNINVQDVAKFSFSAQDSTRTKITDFAKTFDTDKIWNIMASNINSYMLSKLKDPTIWGEYLIKQEGYNPYSLGLVLDNAAIHFKTAIINTQNSEDQYYCATKFKLNFNDENNAAGFYFNFFIDSKLCIDGLSFENGFTYQEVLKELKEQDYINSISRNVNKMTNNKFKFDLKQAAQAEYYYHNKKYNSVYEVFQAMGSAAFKRGNYDISLNLTFYYNQVLSEQVKNEIITIIVK